MYEFDSNKRSLSSVTKGHIRILTVVLETSMKERLMRGNNFKCKLFPPHEPPSHACSSPTVIVRIRSIPAGSLTTDDTNRNFIS